MAAKRAERALPNPRRTKLRQLAVVSAAGVGVSFGALSQTDGGAARRLQIQPSLTLEQTLTNNHALEPVNRKSDGITRLSAGLGIRSTGGGLNATVDYALGLVSFARHSDQNTLQNRLQADANVELIDNRLRLGSTASISRSAVSAFGVQPGLGDDANSNVVELRTLRVAPTLRGSLGTALRYSLGLGLSITDAADNTAGDVTGRSVQLRLEPQRSSLLGWTLDASHQVSDYKRGRSSATSQLVGGLRYLLADQDLQLSTSGGAERSDLASGRGRTTSNWGVGAVWTPSQTTRVSADFARRFFGRSHSLGIDYRTSRTLWQLRSSRDLSTGLDNVGSARSTTYELLFAQLAAVQPDPLLREALVLQTLRERGIDPNQGISIGFLQSAASVQDSMDASVAWTGPRNTASLSLRHGKSRRVDTVATAADDLSGGNVVRTRAVSLNLSHRLTRQASANLVLSQQRGSGSVSAQSNRQDQIALQYSTRLTIDSTLGATLRRVRIQNDNQSFGESALTATYGLRF